ncbi:penicillin-binding transpeptidase domain-containing protein [Pseudonocardia acidicola]|uniref:Penicillin-binding protein n=1 Tax=Pseudonocardia acidicola TaxID=2724939 RepID=A0ABX1S5Y3_9PSEU|nr:penicillin-binding transpeptidase domain-containing protein [Pseudonocardia acidicola]NMH96187.1 penicillin-binding protein [Pseudonocardia acidicola]
MGEQAMVVLIGLAIGAGVVLLLLGARRRAALGTVLAAALLTATGCSSTGDAQQQAGQAFLTAWARGDLAAAAQATDDPGAAQPVLQAVQKSLNPTGSRLTPGAITTKGSTTTMAFTASWTLAGLPAPWRYDGGLALAQGGDGQWRVHWQPQDLVPQLAAGDSLVVNRTLPQRAPILDAAGRPLVSDVPTVTVGVQPQGVTDLNGLAATLASTLNINAGDIVSEVQKAKPGDFVPVITLRQPDYQAVQARIHDLPGTVFRSATQVIGPSPHFGQPLLGQVAQPTAEALKQAGPGYLPTDQIGVSGLQQVFNTQLAGTAGATIEVHNPGGGTVAQVGKISGSPGTPLTTTLDLRVQQAAESALAGVGLNAAIVAVRPSTGAILAVANSASAPFDIALAGHYPPGSTFKMVTASAVVDSGVAGPDTPVPCPGTVTIDGRTIPNENAFDLGTVSLTDAFAHSCNTSFSLLSQKLPPGALDKAAAEYGFGAGWQLPVDSFSGSYTPATDPAGQAANAFGQGTDLVSPLSEALMAATVVHGSTPAPSLIPGKPAAAKNPPPVLPATVPPALSGFMRAVVTSGTATNLAGVPGGPVSGKTGTAEHGTTSPPQADSWFTGFQGDLAFTVLVENGQTGGVPSNPIAQKFLTTLNG